MATNQANSRLFDAEQGRDRKQTTCTTRKRLHPKGPSGSAKALRNVLRKDDGGVFAIRERLQSGERYFAGWIHKGVWQFRTL